jgi:branched-chain amino acid transport system permease protein
MYYYSDVLTVSAISAIAAIGLYIQIASGQINAGQAAFMGLGAYAAGIAAVRYNAGFAESLVIGIVTGLVSAGVFAILIARLSHWFVAVITLAFGEAMSALLLNINAFGGAQGYYDIPLRTSLTSTLVALGMSIVLVLALERTMIRRVWTAMSADERTVEAQGLNTRWIRAGAFALGGAFAGLAGALSAQYVGIVQPTDLDFTGSLTLLVFVCIGGTRTVWGTVIASFAFGVALEALRFSDEARYLLYGLVLMIAVLVRARAGGLGRRMLRKKRTMFAGRTAGDAPGITRSHDGASL